MEKSVDPGNPNRQNCWEFNKCGREPGGNRADDLGVCPAAADRRFDGVNDGINAGRICWLVAGTDGSDQPECIYASSLYPCSRCRYYHLARADGLPATAEQLQALLETPLDQELYILSNT